MELQENKISNGVKKILFIEDDPSLVKSLKEFIEKEGFEYVAAFDGESGLEAAKKESPDLILLDLILPKKSGFDVLNEIKQQDELKLIPIIVLTNLEDGKDIEKVLSLGADSYLVKANYSLEEIVKKIKEKI